MVRYSSAPMPFTLERMTSASIEPPATQYELAAGLLSPSEVANAVITHERVFIKGRLLPFKFSKAGMEDFMSLIRPECLNNGDVALKTITDFSWGSAHSMILRKYGLSHLGLKGTRGRVTGIVVGSVVTYDNQDIHVKRYANVCRAIKSYLPHSRVQYETCFSNNLKCDPELEKKLREWMDEKNPTQPKRDEK